jgi:hypothetical protein
LRLNNYDFNSLFKEFDSMYGDNLGEALSSTGSLGGVQLLLVEDVVEPDEHILRVFKTQPLRETTEGLGG